MAEPGDATYGSEAAPDEFSMPERFAGKTPEDIARSYVELEQMHGRRMQELDPLIRRQQELEPYGGVEGLVNAYSQVVNNYQQLLQQQAAAAQNPSRGEQQPVAPASNSQQNWEENWEYLSPREQARLIREQVAQELMQQISPTVQQFSQQFDQRFQDREQKLQELLNTQRSEFDVFRNLMNIQQRNPNVDPEQLMRKAIELSQSNPQKLLELAMHNMADEDGSQTEAKAKAMFDQFKKDWELQQRNEQIAALQNTGGMRLSQFRGGNEEAPKGQQAMRRHIAERLINDGTLQPGHLADVL